jgi:hypothetical protein
VHQQPFRRQAGNHLLAPAVEIASHPHAIVKMAEKRPDHGAAHEFGYRARQETLDIFRRKDCLAD